MHKTKLKLSLIVGALVFLSGCGINVQTQTSNQGTSDLGGVFVSGDKGESFQQMVLVPTITTSVGSINSADVNELVMDPSDSTAIYLASIDHGLYYTYNVNDGWLKVKSLPEGTVNDVAVDAKNKCTIYVALGNKLYKSDDCSRNWAEVYVDNNPSVTVNAVAVDHYLNKNVYIGTSRGEVIKSLDFGRSWKTIQSLDNGIQKIIINPRDSRMVFVASTKNGLYKFNSNEAVNLNDLANYKNKFDGTNWVDLNGELQQFNLGFVFKGLIFAPNDNLLFLATDKVLLKSTDNGSTWSKIKLITPENETSIEAIAVNPANSRELFYVTDTTFYKSIDGGDNWITKQLRTSRDGSSLLIDFNNPNIIYLGVKKIKK